ncbi:LysR substrate-binding domain-containing protein [Thalassotalea sp. PS06]|uniref:LysR substrate-binding domain-containing protein n=1 Tax=Thalassotalea sp. PS06 TaxID=2594005 RepID=UPI0011622F45|nr:LysR substrate-binding domain-containing protein [Thalassotalea sp. PS06]QDP01061.1 LysR family transcriptional regulator [Thalassotalea sp. PS06]
MARKIPPAHLLVVFEAAGRHQSFKHASEELFITPSAVSHQIRSLEEFLGFELFQRDKRGVTLNNAGQFYLKYVSQSLEKLEHATRQLQTKFQSNLLKISTFPSLSRNIILPQLSNFQNQNPELDIRIETSMNLLDLRYEDIDLAFRIGDGKWPDVAVEKILDVRIIAVCSPDFQKQHGLKDVRQIADVPLIDLADMDNVWGNWSKAVGNGKLKVLPKLTFNDYDASLQAAEQGLGVALAMQPIENYLLKSKILVDPFQKNAEFPMSLYAVFRESERQNQAIQAFIHWVKEMLIAGE